MPCSRLACFGLIAVLACQPAPVADPDEGSPAGVGVILEYRIPDTEADEWIARKDAWMRETYGPCLRRFKLRMSCGGCSAIVLQVDAAVDAGGRMRSYTKFRDQVCGRPAEPEFEECLIKPVREWTFPASVRGRTMRVYFGTGLSC